MEKEDLLNAIRLEYPDSEIHDIVSYEKNNFGFLNVKIDTSANFFGTTILHSYVIIPYLSSEFNKLTATEQEQWHLDNNL